MLLIRANHLILRSLLLLTILVAGACVPTRPPLPPGYIPPEPYLATEDERYGHQVLVSLMREFDLERDDRIISRVRRVADRITKDGIGSRNTWHVYVLRSDRIKNAAATKGNHLFVWTPLLSSMRNDAELATVLSHEIAHVIAGHTQDDPRAESAKILGDVMGEATSQLLGIYGGVAPLVGAIAGSLISSGVDAAINNPAQQQKELEADQIGIMLLAKAGYDPRAAIDLWDRLQHDPDFSGPRISFLSTHPSSKERLEKLRQNLPEALAIYRGRSGSTKPISDKKTNQWTIE